jgi:hypothetical protein
METRTEVLPVHLDEQNTMLVQVTMLDAGERKVSALKGGFSFENVINSVEKISVALAKTVAKVRPTKAAIEFGIELASKEGQLTALLVQGSATANLTIKLEWEKKTPEKK